MLLLLTHIRVALHACKQAQVDRQVRGPSLGQALPHLPPEQEERQARCVCIACYLYHRCMYTYLKLERDMEMISSILVIHIFFSENWFLFVLFIFPKENKNSNTMIEQ